MVHRHLGAQCAVTRQTRLSGGASQESWAIEVHGPGVMERLVLRRVPAVVERRREVKRPAGSANEARLMQIMKPRGVPVPTVRWILDAEDGLGEGFVMDWMDGETIGRKIVRDAAYARARENLAFDCGAALARIHLTPRDELPALRETHPQDYLDGTFREYERQGHRRPVFEMAFQWLRRHIGRLDPALCLVHGDFRTGNYILGQDGLRGVLDWEIAHIGHPMEDLGWFCIGSWRFGQVHLPAGGVGSREALFAGYESAGGRVDPQAVRFWQVMGSLTWGLDCVEFAREFQRGDRTVERAAIGRRASENEIDLLRLLNPREPR